MVKIVCIISQNCKNYSKSLLKDTVRVLAVVMSLQSKESAATMSVKAAKSNLFDYFHGVKANVARQMFPGTRLGASASKLDSVTQWRIFSVKHRQLRTCLAPPLTLPLPTFGKLLKHCWQESLLLRSAPLS